MEEKVTIPADIRQFLESILDEAEMVTVDDEMREAMVQELFYQLDNYLASVVVKNLDPEALEIFIKMNEEKKSKEEIEQFVQEKIPQAQEVFANAFIDFKRLYLENVDTSRAVNSTKDEEEE
jgi:Protein of unknown function (DUF5663)